MLLKFKTSLSYTRNVDESTNKLINGDYVWTTITGEKSQKVCTLNFDQQLKDTLNLLLAKSLYSSLYYLIARIISFQ